MDKVNKIKEWFWRYQKDIALFLIVMLLVSVCAGLLRLWLITPHKMPIKIETN